MPKLHELIADRRKELKMTQRALAEKINVSDKTVSKWETGTSYPDLLMLPDLAKALELTPSQLLRAEEFSEEKRPDRKALDTDRISIFIKDMMISTFLILLFSILGLGGFVILSLVVGSVGVAMGVFLLTSAVVVFFAAFLRYFLGMVRFQGFYKDRYDSEDYSQVCVKYLPRFWDAFAVTLLIVTLPTSYLQTVTPVSIGILWGVKTLWIRKLGYAPKLDRISIAMGILFAVTWVGCLLLWNTHFFGNQNSLLIGWGMIGICWIASVVFTARIGKRT